MSKEYKGWDLLKEIADGNIKEGTQFKNLNENPMYDNRNIYVYKNNNLIGRFGGMNITAILNDDFEIIEEEPEIDIQGIEETEIKNDGRMDYFEYFNDGETESKYSVDYSKSDLATRKIINQLIKAVKQLDKQINNK